MAYSLVIVNQAGNVILKPSLFHQLRHVSTRLRAFLPISTVTVFLMRIGDACHLSAAWMMPAALQIHNGRTRMVGEPGGIGLYVKRRGK
jgi:hypothetical protein